MDIRQGIAIYVKKEIRSGRADEKETAPSAVTFQIGGQLIRIAIGSTPIIDHGDKIIVAGKIDKKEVLHVYAYKNLTKIVEGSAGWETRFALSAIALLPSLFFNDLLLAFIAGSLYFFFHGVNVVNAIERVRSEIWSGPIEQTTVDQTAEQSA
ncbi:MAG: hypothetical protein AAB035_00280 [Nitrospirota bacterium]